MPESGQGALGPSLVPVGQTYDDYRSHPAFTRKMERFLKALFGVEVEFVFPQIWQTKAETLRRFIEECDDPSWTGTRVVLAAEPAGGRRREDGGSAACAPRACCAV